MFSFRASAQIARSLFLGRRNPIYVQFYITARCNLTCKQCNIIYANADVREASTEEIDRIAENLAQVGCAIVLLTGGEPFIRKDIGSVVRSFTSRGIHVRTQTNGLASEEQFRAVVASGARDISISLDSLLEEKQDFLNGSHKRSWSRALETIALVTRTYPIKSSFAAFGTVLSPHNILEIPNIIRFATRIGWHVSLVPAHISGPDELFNFRSSDAEMKFTPEMFPLVDRILDECIALKKSGMHLYDSIEYLKNIRLFIRGEALQWRRRNAGRCDSPELYFAIRPNGDIQSCCDHVLKESFPVWDPRFPEWYRDGTLRREIHPITVRCPGCMYGSYPEISITAHYPMTTLSRIKLFSLTHRPKPWPLTHEQLVGFVDEINRAHPVDHELMARHLENRSSHALVSIGRSRNREAIL
jgi:MoaA/NifB/PqqE/SkfB family radical SAM enzyme